MSNNTKLLKQADSHYLQSISLIRDCHSLAMGEIGPSDINQIDFIKIQAMLTKTELAHKDLWQARQIIIDIINENKEAVQEQMVKKVEGE